MSMLSNIVRRLKLIVARGVVELVNDAAKAQGLQLSLLSDELQDNVERFQDYGITSVPFTGAEAIFLAVGGNRANGVAICVMDRDKRPKDLVEGDVCLYTDKGERVYLNRVDDIVHLGAKSAAQFVALAADVKARLDSIQSTFDAHIHTTTATIGPSAVPGVIAPTATPIGALAGVAATKVKAT